MHINTNGIKTICKEHGIQYMGLFGSHARGHARDNSDIDLLVDFRDTKSLFELSRIKASLEKLFGKNVDLTLQSSLKKNLKPYVYKDLILIHGKN